MKRSIFLILLTIIMNCSRNKSVDFNRYYVINFNDNINLIVKSDSVQITIKQIAVNSLFKSTIPYDIENDPSLIDTIKIFIDVSYGGYNLILDPNELIINNYNNICIWYPEYNPSELDFNKGHYYVRGCSSLPKLTYYLINSVSIYKSVNKKVSFKYILFRKE